MPIPTTIRINPLDLQKNIAIGISLPFNSPSAFTKTYSTQDQIKSNLINLLLTNKGERIMNPEFGTDLRQILFEGINVDTEEIIKQKIISSVGLFIPDVIIKSIIITPIQDTNTITVSVYYNLPISGNSDQITVQFT